MKKVNFLIKEVANGGKIIKYVKLSESPFFYIIYALKNVEFPNFDTNFDDIIKVVNVKNSNDIIVEGVRYSFWISTPSQMKGNQAFYVKSSLVESYKIYEKVVSDGGVKTLEGEKISIAKDIIARLSLLFSGASKTSIKPNVIVLPDVSFTTVQDAYKIENDELVKEENYELEHTAFDGTSLGAPAIFEKIRAELGLDYNLSYITYRIPRQACKGSLINVDFLRYFSDNYQGDTEYLKKVDGVFYLKDNAEAWRELNDNTIIMNESCAKWNKLYLENDFMWDRYSDVMDCLYVCKYSKPVKELATTSYQSLSATMLTANEIATLSKPTHDFYKRVLGYEKGAILELLKMDIDSDENENEYRLSAQKLDTLLGLDYERFINTSYVRLKLKGLVDKKIKWLSGGKFYLQGSHFKLATQDLIAYMIFAKTRELTPHLKNFYSKDTEGERAGIRYPVANPYELQVINYSYEEFTSKYCNIDSEIMVFPLSNHAHKWSGCDMDGDTILNINNQTIITSIIRDDSVFINSADATLKEVYTSENRIARNIAGMGNIIGKLAIGTANICENIKEATYRYNGELKNRAEMVDIFRGQLEACFTDEDKIAVWNEIKGYELNNEEQRAIYIEKFNENRELLFKLTNLSMKSIDQCKTGCNVTDEEIEALIEKCNRNKMFLRMPEKYYSISDFNNLYTPLARLSDFTKSTLIDRCKRLIIDKDKDNETWNKILAVLRTQENVELTKEIEEIHRLFNESLNYAKQYNGDLSIVYNSALAQCDDVKDRFSDEEIATSLSKLINSNKKNINIFIIDNFFEIIEKVLDGRYQHYNILKRCAGGELKGMFNSYNLVQTGNIDFSKLNKVEAERKKKEFGENITIGIQKCLELQKEMQVEVSDEGIFLLGATGKYMIWNENLIRKNIVLNDGDILTIAGVAKETERSMQIILKSIN